MATKQDSETISSGTAGALSSTKSEHSPAMTPNNNHDAPDSNSTPLPVRDKDSYTKFLIDQYGSRDRVHAAAMVAGQEALNNHNKYVYKMINDYKLVRNDYRLWFSPSRLYGEGYNGYGNAHTEIGGPSRLMYPQQKPRPGKKGTPQLKWKRKDMKAQAEQHEELVPIRLDVDWDKIRLRDTFTWNLHERIMPPELFAAQLVDDMGLKPPAFNPVYEQIVQQMGEQLNDFYPFVFSVEDALDPELPYSAWKNDEMRILVKLNITIGAHTLVDQFEWEINNPLNSPEEFAASMAKELSLSGEFTTAIAHCIREQTQLFTQSLYSIGHPFDGRPIEDPDLVAAFLPSPLPSVFRPQQQAKEYAPYLYELSEADLERNEVCLSPDTLVRTTEGQKAIRDINVGTKLFDHNDMPVVCTAVGDIKTSSTMKTITYKEWNSKRDVTFDCTSDHIMSMKSYGVRPAIKHGCVLVWYTRCDRTELKKEVKDLKWDELTHRLYSELSKQKGRRPTDAEAHEYINSLVDQWAAAPSDLNGVLSPVFQQFKDTSPAEELANLEDASLEPNFREVLHGHMDEYLEHLIPEQEEVPDDDDLEIDLDALRPCKFRKFSRMPSSTHPSDLTYRSTTVGPSLSPLAQQEFQSAPESQGSSFADTAQLIRKKDHLEKFAAVREAISPKCNHPSGPCRAFKTYQIRFKNEEQARLALDLLSGEHFRIVDPFAVQNGDTWTMTLDEYEASCANKSSIGNRKLELYRAPLRFVHSEAPTTSVPVDPYYMGFWLGDGSKAAAEVCGTDLETKAYLQAYVDRLNHQRPDGEPALILTERILHTAGDTSEVKNHGSEGTLTMVSPTDVFHWRISSTKKGPVAWNPVLKGLRNLVFAGEDKTSGIPACYMEADEDTRLAVLAGLIESGGHRINKTYRFSQMTYEHKQIVEDAHKLALSCGVQCSSIRQYDIKDRKEPRWEFNMFKGCEKFQHHLLLPRKKLDGLKPGRRNVNSVDAHKFSISEPHDGEYRSIEVSGGLYQLANRTVVHNCFEREQRRQKRSVNRRGGPSLPDLKERQRTIRTLVVSSTLPGAATDVEESRLYKRVAGASGRKRPGARDGDITDSSESEDSSPDSPAASQLAGTARTRGMRGAASAAQQRMANLGRSETPEATIHHHETRTSRRFGRELTREETEEPQHQWVTLKVNKEKLKKLFRDMKLKHSTPSGSQTPSMSHTQAPSASAQSIMPPPSTLNASNAAAATTKPSSNGPGNGQIGRLEAPHPPPAGHQTLPTPPPPVWLVQSLKKFKEQDTYKNDQFEGAMRYTAFDSTRDAPCPMPPPGAEIPSNVRFYWLPRIRCLDCPGKLYTPGPEMTAINFEVHLKNRQHREKVDVRLAEGNDN